ncbi:hypothetical protein Ancab_006770 [Ancistrocladus abbreviatus]
MIVLGERRTSFHENEMEDNVEGNVSSKVSEFELESESEEEKDVKLAEHSKNAICDKDGLLDKLGDHEVDVNDDLACELSFYIQALEGTRQALGKLEYIGLPFLRHTDYYAEMVKSVAHIEKKKQIEEAEERRKAREAKRIAKEVQAEKLRERAKQKKEQIESVKKWRK